MKRIVTLMFAAAMAIGCTANASAQERTWESDIIFSFGRFLDNDSYSGNDKGRVVKLGYGINRYFTDNYSFMLGVVRHVDKEFTYDDSLPGSDEDDFVFLDVPLLFQYHTNNNGFGNLMFGIGPVISRCIDNDYYEVQGDPRTTPLYGLNHKKKIKEYNFSIMPCVAYETRYFLLGVDASIGLRDVKKTYGLISGSKYIHNVCFTIAAKF